MQRSIEAHLGTRQVARVIYGSIIGLALIVVHESHPPRPMVVVGSLIATAIAVALAELYSEAVGSETRLRRRLERSQLAEILDDAVAVAFGVAFPAVFFLLAALGVMTIDTAFTVAKWSGLGIIGLYGYAAARLAGARLIGCLVQGVGAALIGAVLIALKA